jgi:flagellar protein FliS
MTLTAANTPLVNARAIHPRLDPYFESEVLHADPVKLVTLLYRGALEAISAARAALQAGDIPGRSRQILKAWRIVQELRESLNPAQGGEISRQLAELYAWVCQRLLDANTLQSEAPLAEAARVLGTLAEAWHAISGAPQGAAPAQPASAAC